MKADTDVSSLRGASHRPHGRAWTDQNGWHYIFGTIKRYGSNKVLAVERGRKNVGRVCRAGGGGARLTTALSGTYL